MDEALESTLRELVTSRSTAALGTLHSGAPYVSMVPYALLSDGSAFIVHVSLLAAHTRDMLADPRVSLLISEPERAGVSPQALPRVTVLGTARRLPRESPEEAASRDAYLARFPDAAPMFGLGDFSLFAITPTAVRWVAGFAQARSLTPASFAAAVRSSRD
jgi:heme iron utilization protein